MIDEEKSFNLASDKTPSFLLAHDRFSLYHLQQKHESLQQKQQEREKKNHLLGSETPTTSRVRTTSEDVISNISELDYSRSSSSTSTFYSDNGSITSSTLTPSSIPSISARRNINSSKSYKPNMMYDLNNNEKQHTSSRKDHYHYQRSLSHKKMKHSKVIQSKVSSKLVNKRKLQAADNSKQFLDDVSLGLLRFYRAATKATVNRSQKPSNLSNQQIDKINDNNNYIKRHKDAQKSYSAVSCNAKKEDETLLEGDIFYSMSPEEFVPYLTQNEVSTYFYVSNRYHLV